MAQTDSVCDRGSLADLANSMDAPVYEAEEAGKHTGCSALTLTPADYQVLLAELARTQAADAEKVARIYHLEQALDQALVYLEELRLKVQNQDFVEGQLAATEDFASVQQQAIARFKLQIAEQQQALDSQMLETQQRDQAIQELLATIETMTQAQQQEVERLRLRLSQDQLEAKAHRNRMGKQFQELQIALEAQQQRASELEAEILAVRTPVGLPSQQVAEMQEQILQQAQQVTEYETAIQYWKDRYATSQRQIAHIRDLVEQTLTELAIEDEAANLLVAELLAALQTIQPAMPPEHLELLPIALPLPRLGSVELPNFLVRRRAQAQDRAGG